MKAGASGYLLKSMLRKELLETIRAVHAGRRRVPPEIATGIAEHAAELSANDRTHAVTIALNRGIIAV